MIANRFEKRELLGKGSFGTVFKGLDSKTKMPIAIKECESSSHSYFKIEAGILSLLSGKSGFPKLIYHGKYESKFYIVMTLLGSNLNSTIQSEGYSLKDICRIGKQVIKILRKFHEKSFIHRDLKPENILKGLKRKKKYYLIDFGLAKKYIDKNINYHIPLKNDLEFKGNLVFCSNNVLTGIEASRRDDIISLMHILLFMLKKGLPWCSAGDSQSKMINLRSFFLRSDLTRETPFEISECYNYATSLGFYQAPDYRYIYDLLTKCKNSFGLHKTVAKVNLKTAKKKPKRKKVLVSDFENSGYQQIQSGCSTVEIEAPEFSIDLRRRIELLRENRRNSICGV